MDTISKLFYTNHMTKLNQKYPLSRKITHSNSWRFVEKQDFFIRNCILEDNKFIFEKNIN